MDKYSVLKNGQQVTITKHLETEEEGSWQIMIKKFQAIIPNDNIEKELRGAAGTLARTKERATEQTIFPEFLVGHWI